MTLNTIPTLTRPCTQQIYAFVDDLTVLTDLSRALMTLCLFRSGRLLNPYHYLGQSMTSSRQYHRKRRQSQCDQETLMDLKS